MHAVMGKRASKVKQQGLPRYEHRSLKSGKAKFPCLLPAACNLLIHRAGRRWSVDRGGPGPLTAGSSVRRGASRDVWATHRSDPAQVLKVKWTHYVRPRNSSNLDSKSGVIFSIMHKELLKMWYWWEGYVKECGFSPQPIKEESIWTKQRLLSHTVIDY